MRALNLGCGLPSGAQVELVEHRLVRRLSRTGIRVTPLAPGEDTRYALPEPLAMNVGLLFRTLASMRAQVWNHTGSVNAPSRRAAATPRTNAM